MRLSTIIFSFLRFTIITCSFVINDGSKIYECQNCHIKLDRDYNACRNIYIKYLFINKK